MTNNLTTRANVNQWLDEDDSTNTDNPLITRLIAQASRFIYAYLQRPTLFQQVYSDVYDGSGSCRQILRNWPVLSVSSLTVGTQSITAASSYGQTGYALEPSDPAPPGRPQALNLTGYAFCMGNANVAVSYTAGYVVQNEAQVIPATPYKVTVSAPYGNWAVDQGVSFATGAALTPVAANPAAGQYSVSDGLYTFNAANTGQAVLISYSYMPADIEQCCIEIVAERLKYSSRIGEVSKSLGGQETISYSQKNMPDYISDALLPYRKIILL